MFRFASLITVAGKEGHHRSVILQPSLLLIIALPPPCTHLAPLAWVLFKAHHPQVSQTAMQCQQLWITGTRAGHGCPRALQVDASASPETL